MVASGRWGGAYSGPIFDFNKSLQRVEIEKERTRQALYQYENRVLFAFREVSDALNEIQTYKKQISAVKRKFKAAKNASFLSKMRYDKGVTSYLEVLDTERTLFDVGLELSELKQQFLNAYVKLYKALGRGMADKGGNGRGSQKEIRPMALNPSSSFCFPSYQS